MEVSSNKNLSDDAKLSGDQIKALDDLAIKSRRQGYSLGKLLSAVQPTDIPNIAVEIDFTILYNFSGDISIGILCTSYSQSSNLQSGFIGKDERKCAQ